MLKNYSIFIGSRVFEVVLSIGISFIFLKDNGLSLIESMIAALIISLCITLGGYLFFYILQFYEDKANHKRRQNHLNKLMKRGELE